MFYWITVPPASMRTWILNFKLMKNLYLIQFLIILYNYAYITVMPIVNLPVYVDTPDK